MRKPRLLLMAAALLLTLTSGLVAITSDEPAQAAIGPADSFYSGDLHEYILPYDTVRNAENPERALMDFLMSTYDAAATLGKWDRAALDCAIGVPGKPRAIGA